LKKVIIWFSRCWRRRFSHFWCENLWGSHWVKTYSDRVLFREKTFRKTFLDVINFTFTEFVIINYFICVLKLNTFICL
jgi:hypothetical protein